MRLSPTLSVYIARQFVVWCGVTFAAFTVLIVVFDLADLLRRASVREQVTTGVVLEMAFLRLPALALSLVPFAVLFGGMLAFWRLTRSRELVVTRSFGVSVWQFLTPTLLCALALGVLKIALLEPGAAALAGRWEQLESAYFDRGSSISGLFPSGLWLRQADGAGHAVIHAERSIPEAAALDRVVIFRFSAADRFLSRIDAKRADLRDGRWILKAGRETMAEDPSTSRETTTLTTDLTWERIEDSFAPPGTLSFWELPAFIEAMETAGFSAVRHRLYYQSMLAFPVLLCGMALVAATFSLRPARRGAGPLVAGGIATGFAFYIASDIVLALGISGRVPIGLAAWAPAAICLLLGTSMLLHLEDA